MKKIMILGAGRGQVDLITATLRYGYQPIVVSIQGDYPGFDITGIEKCYADISDPYAVLNAAREYKIDAIATSCLDTGIPALGAVCDALNLKGLSQSAAELSVNKFLMKEAFKKYGVNTAKFYKIHNINELNEQVRNLSYPLIIKAIDLQGSRGINIVRNHARLEQALNDTMLETKEDFCIVEEFLEGQEFGVQAFVQNGEIIYFLPCGDITLESKTNIPIGHYAPMSMTPAEYDDIRTQSVKAIKALGLDNCAVNIDLIKKDDKIYLIELTGRIGANCLPEIISTYYGIDVYKMILDNALGLDVKSWFAENKKEGRACYAKMLYSQKTGYLQNIINSNKKSTNILDISFFVKHGETVKKFENSKDCLGSVVVQGSSVSDCERFIDKVIANIILEVTDD